MLSVSSISGRCDRMAGGFSVGARAGAGSTSVEVSYPLDGVTKSETPPPLHELHVLEAEDMNEAWATPPQASQALQAEVAVGAAIITGDNTTGRLTVCTTGDKATEPHVAG
jgi:hypothetical protein